MCKKNQCYIVVKYILENVLILNVFGGEFCMPENPVWKVCGSVAIGLEILIKTTAVYLSQALSPLQCEQFTHPLQSFLHVDDELLCCTEFLL
jgi:hypothetical protein